MKSRIFIIVSYFLMPFLASAQNAESLHHHWFGSVDYHQIFSFSYQYPGYTWTGSDMYSAKSLRVITGYYIDPRISVGAGISIDNYQAAGSAATFPLLLDVRGYLKKDITTPFAYMTGSYSFKSGDFEKSYGVETGVGYKIRLKKKLCLNATVSYNFKRYPHMEVLEINYPTFEWRTYFAGETVHSLSVGIGMSF